MIFAAFGLFGCTGQAPTDTAAACDAPAAEGVTAYDVGFGTEPSSPVAGSEAEFWLQVVDQRGCPIEDLQQAHERMVHTLFISADLASFQHLHHEDFAALTADDLRSATYRFPVRLPLGGDYRLVFDFAHVNQYRVDNGWIAASGGPAQASAPVIDAATERVVDGMTVSIAWDVAPFAGFESAWTIRVVDAAGGEIADLVPWLGADAHAAVASADLAYVSHTHAWFPGMEDAAPGHPMPHLYDGPELPFHFTFPTAGTYKMWVQFARAAAPDVPHVAEFAVSVAP